MEVQTTVLSGVESSCFSEVELVVNEFEKCTDNNFESQFLRSFLKGSMNDGINLFHMNLHCSDSYETTLMVALLRASILDGNYELQNRLIQLCNRTEMLDAIVESEMFGNNIFRFFEMVISATDDQRSQMNVFVTMVKYHCCIESFHAIIKGSFYLSSEFVRLFFDHPDIIKLIQFMDIKKIEYNKFPFMMEAVKSNNTMVWNYFFNSDWSKDVDFNTIVVDNRIDMIDMIHNSGIEFDYEELIEYCVVAGNCDMLNHIIELRKDSMDFDINEIFKYVAPHCSSMMLIDVFMQNGASILILEECAPDTIENGFIDLVDLLKYLHEHTKRLSPQIVDAAHEYGDDECYRFLVSLGLIRLR